MSLRRKHDAGLVRLPSWPRRWLMLLSRYPSLLWDAEFLLKSVVGKSGLTWSHALRWEEERLLRKAVSEGRACLWQRPRGGAEPNRGNWHGEPV